MGRTKVFRYEINWHVKFGAYRSETIRPKNLGIWIIFFSNFNKCCHTFDVKISPSKLQHKIGWRGYFGFERGICTKWKMRKTRKLDKRQNPNSIQIGFRWWWKRARKNVVKVTEINNPMKANVENVTDLVQFVSVRGWQFFGMPCKYLVNGNMMAVLSGSRELWILSVVFVPIAFFILSFVTRYPTRTFWVICSQSVQPIQVWFCADFVVNGKLCSVYVIWHCNTWP